MERLRLELVEWTPLYPIGNVSLHCMSHTQLLSYCSRPPLPLSRSRSWVCPRCEKSNLECLPDPSPGGPSPETVEPQPPETNPEVEVTQVTKDDVPILETAVADLPQSSSLQDQPPGEPLPTTTPIVPQAVVITRSPVGDPRPPLLLDTAICVLLVLALALLFRRFT